ncbi:hypothetical protein CUMW_009540 [Citrus unshiu]|nr:hypothetical protein CUMW_009540 [Citrus unshiu]
MAGEEEQQKQADPPSQPPFDPSRMIGIIKRKALIKELAALYHAECLAYCQELLELQKKWEESRATLLQQDVKNLELKETDSNSHLWKQKLQMIHGKKLLDFQNV